jgi:chromosomal replication initiator protein
MHTFLNNAPADYTHFNRGFFIMADQDYRFIWEQVLQALSDEIGSSFDIWFSTTQYRFYNNGLLHILVPNLLTKEWIEARYLKKMQQKLQEISRENIHILLVAEDDKKSHQEKYTFDTFVVGNSNRFAHAACYAVGESPSRAYNPLFIYGGVGLGKTHLMKAIGHRILGNNPSFKVMYVSSEQFTNELISAIKDDNTPGFRNKYRNIDVLLIDDIQFLAGKERTQEEFFHTFNSLHEANKQLVISSDRPPKNIPTLEDRLCSRFEWGLITDIQPPDFETRVAILRKKAQTDQLDISYDILDYIASSINSNIRELEGALVRLFAYSNIENKPLNMDTAIKALKDILPPPEPKQITIEFIQKEVSLYYHMDQAEFLSKKRNSHIVYPRHIAMFLCRKLTEASLPLIGDQFGGRDHTTVMHAIKKVENDSNENIKIKTEIEELINIIKPKTSS